MVRRHVVHTVLFAGLFMFSLSRPLQAQVGKPDAENLLQQVSEKYRNAKSYHFEAVEEREIKGDLFTDREKVTLVAGAASGGRSRFEAHGRWGSVVKISDGKTETYYHPEGNEYTQTPVSVVNVNRPMLTWEPELQFAQGLQKALYQADTQLAPEYLPEETLSINGKSIPCYVPRHGSSRSRFSLFVNSADSR